MIGKLLVIPITKGVMIMLLIIHMLCLPLVLLMILVDISLGAIMLCLMRLGEIMLLGKCAMNLLLFFMLATFLLYFHIRTQK
jgi:hypothetical protein